MGAVRLGCAPRWPAGPAPKQHVHADLPDSRQAGHQQVHLADGSQQHVQHAVCARGMGRGQSTGQGLERREHGNGSALGCKGARAVPCRALPTQYAPCWQKKRPSAQEETLRAQKMTPKKKFPSSTVFLSCGVAQRSAACG